MLYVIYDDRCGFCIRSLKVCRALDVNGRLAFQGSSSFRLKPEATRTAPEATRTAPEATRTAPEATPDRVDSSGFRLQPEGAAGLADADFDNAVFTLAPDCSVARGFFAFRRIARELPLMWPLLPLFYLPGSRALGPRVYAWIARHRRRLGCESELCELPEAGRPRP